MLRYLLLFALAFVSLLTTIIPSLQVDNSSADVATILQYLCGILLLEILILISCWRLVDVRSSILLAAVLTCLNAQALSLSFSQDFLALPRIAAIATILAVAILAFTVYWASYRQPRFGLFAALLYLAAIVFQTISTLPENSRGLQGTQKVDFHYFPNLYIVSVDSMIPEALAGRLLGKEFAKLEYAEFFRGVNATIFRNVFADRIPTKQSLNALLNLSINPHTDGGDKHRYFTGVADSIVYRIFRENGYSISSGFEQAGYFGPKGRFIDEYSELTGKRFPFCKFRLKWYYLQFFGFCFASDAVKKMRDMDNASWSARVLASIKEKASNRNERWLTYYYVYEPIGHTPLDFSISDERALRAYRQHFGSQVPKLVSFLKELLSTVRAHDPDGIILVFGDHGAWLSRDLEIESGERFWIQDRHGVFAAVVGNPRCRPGGDFGSNGGGFTTPSLILARLLSCLSGAKFLADALPGQQWEHDFGRFLYE
jgi:hypothetical protein